MFLIPVRAVVVGAGVYAVSLIPRGEEDQLFLQPQDPPSTGPVFLVSSVPPPSPSPRPSLLQPALDCFDRCCAKRGGFSFLRSYPPPCYHKLSLLRGSRVRGLAHRSRLQACFSAIKGRRASQGCCRREEGDFGLPAPGVQEGRAGLDLETREILSVGTGEV